MSIAETDHLARADHLLDLAYARLRRVAGESDLRRARRIPGVIADARALGVSHPHLSQVLHGRRPSKSLLARYQALKRRQKQEAA